MIDTLTLPPPTPDASPSAPIDPGDDPQFARRWLQEIWLTRVRWCGVPLGLLLIPLFPTVSRPLTVVLVAALTLGNLWMGRLLRRQPDPTRLRAARRLATALDWTIGLGVIGLRGHDPRSDAQALLLVLILLTGTRHRLRGVIVATLLAVLVVGAQVATQALVLDVLHARAAIQTLIVWELLVGLMALVVGGMVRAGDAWFDWEIARCERQGAELRRLRSGLSPQEWKVLSLLPREELTTYRQIGAILHMEAETVRWHVKQIAKKLGVPAQRKVVVAAAQERGWPPTTETTPPPPP